jgi:hypothetical protein
MTGRRSAGVAGHRVVEPAGDGGARGGAGEELREPQVVQVEEDAAQRAREEVGAQQAAVVDDDARRHARQTQRGAARRRRMPATTSSGSGAGSIASPWQSPAGETSTDPLGFSTRLGTQGDQGNGIWGQSLMERK